MESPASRTDPQLRATKPTGEEHDSPGDGAESCQPQKMSFR